MRKRRFSEDFKREAVRLVRESGKSMTQVARELGIGVSLLARWRHKADAIAASGLTPDGQAELQELRKENARLRMEVEILGKATAFFASRSK